LRYLAVGLIALLASAPALAEPIPAEVLERARGACLAENKGVPNIETMCTCYVVQLSRAYSLQGFLTMEAEAQDMLKRGYSKATVRNSFPEVRSAVAACQR
jgi:hypothetical protein